MAVLISKLYLGTPRHFSYDGEEYSWSSKITESDWVFGEDHPREIGSIAKHLGFELSGFENLPHAKVLLEMTPPGTSIPWAKSVPRPVFQKTLKDLVEQLWCVSNSPHINYYGEHLVDNRRMLQRLQRASVDLSVIDSISRSEKDYKAKDVLKFKPESGTLAPPTRYSFLRSVTGRMTVVEGPNILTLKKSHREIFKSRYKGGSVVQVDISSLEPRIALALSKKNAPKDIYTHVREQVLSESVSRSDAKIAVLSCIYGSNAWSLSKRLPSGINTHDVISKVKSYFDIPALSRSLEEESKQHGMIKNFYGRPVFSSDSLVNHYLQSTGVEVSFDVFRGVLDFLDTESADYAPVYVIHDAMVIDASRDALAALNNLSREGIFVKKLDCTFPVKVERLKE